MSTSNKAAAEAVEIENRTYAEVLAEKYAGRTVEILFDSDWGQRLYAEFSINNKPTVVGEIIGAEDNCLDLKVNIISQNIIVTKVMSVNAWSILSVSEYDDKTSQVLAFTHQVLGKQ